MLNLRSVLDAHLESLVGGDGDGLSDDELRALSLSCGPELLLASLDLIDRRASQLSLS